VIEWLVAQELFRRQCMPARGSGSYLVLASKEHESISSMPAETYTK